jgi:hypothetical protein
MGRVRGDEQEGEMNGEREMSGKRRGKFNRGSGMGRMRGDEQEGEMNGKREMSGKGMGKYGGQGINGKGGR